MFNFFKRKKKEKSIPENIIPMCLLRGIPCSHVDPEGLENCRMCEHYNFWDYLEWQKTGKPVKYK